MADREVDWGDFIIWDDPETLPLTPEQRERIRAWYEETVRTRLTPAPGWGLTTPSAMGPPDLYMRMRDEGVLP